MWIFVNDYKSLKLESPQVMIVFLQNLGANILCHPLQYLVKKCIDDSIFPTALKKAEITPIYKKGNSLQKENYRPVSVLPCVSKIFEGVMVDQLSQYFE